MMNVRKMKEKFKKEYLRQMKKLLETTIYCKILIIGKTLGLSSLLDTREHS